MKNNTDQENNLKRAKIQVYSIIGSIILIGGAILVITRQMCLYVILTGIIVSLFVMYNALWGKYDRYLYGLVWALISVIFISVCSILSLHSTLIYNIMNWPLPKK